MTSEAQGLPIDPTTYTQGGGPAIQLDMVITEARFALWDYGGQAPQTVALQLKLQDRDGIERVQYYSCGDPRRVSPSASGKRIIPSGPGVSAFNMGSNFGLLMTAVVNAGFPLDKLRQDDISILEGLDAYWDGVPAPKRAGLKGQREGAIISVPTKINKLPWETKPAQAPRQLSVVIDEATRLVEQALVNGPVQRNQIVALIFRSADLKTPGGILSEYIFSADFPLDMAKRGFKVAGETVSR